MENYNSKAVLVVIPAYNEQDNIARVIADLREVGFSTILVIDDGSSDNTGTIVSRAGVSLITHPVNMGVGAAIRTGFSYAINGGFDFVMTFDGDGQMLAEDALRLYEKSNKGYNFVYGCRDFNTLGTPKIRKITNWLADGITALLSGKVVRDTQSGLKCIATGLLKNMHLKSMGYSICSEVVIESIRNGITPEPVKIDAIYTKESLKKGQKVSNSFKVVKELLG